MYIPKADGSLRALGIPNLFYRAYQALWTMALDPIAESQADANSFGFRPYRSTQDAISTIQLKLGGKWTKVRWILDADIKKYFDSIAHK